MLVLGRKTGESIVIKCGEETIIVKVSEFRNGHVRLAFEAPRHVRITRAELFEDKQGKEEAK